MAMGWQMTPSLANGGGYGGALDPAAALMGVHPQIRVRLVFVEEVAAFVMRKRGFGSCWFLLPRNLRLVGDLMHEILDEFELGECCPDGLVLLLDGFHVLPNQEIGVLRDHDVIAVQCAPVESGVTRANDKKNTSKTSKKKRKLADTEKKSVEEGEKKPKKTKKSSDRLENASPVVKMKVKAKNAQPEQPIHAPLPKPVADTSSSDSESSSSSSSSSSSDSEGSGSEEDVSPSVKTPTRKAPAKDAKEISKDDTNARTRRRRRPRRRPKVDPTGKTPAVAPSATPALKAAPVPAEKHVEATQAPLRPLRIRGLPPSSAKPDTRNHFRFDVNSTIPDKSIVQIERAVPPQLRKYGPPAANSRRETQNGNHHSSNERHNGNSDEPVKPKAKSVDMWKRPYEIIASIADSNDPAAAKMPDMSELLAAYPAKPLDTKSLPTSAGLQADDVVAYKTVTLCMETWQPIVSEWQCGRVTSVDESEQVVAFDLYMLKRNGPSLRWQPVHQESTSVSLGELSEVRYLQGPTHQAVANE
ncbi:hypothetical protein Poli38472_002414 [Pythium oligandrum]|uniref:Coilin N-terminal domain-containing protein n=1 Tax=Pythium oligandrum TaxID=41045 RepID=A0A8K1CJA5_PYTOL|nr:hypothetical protein Poli38472_002414 [Pythium oligandrum]|eukprot:TMW63473.1 hypothetical protein Poli38472_002414 [Pythium oligandrum]